MDRLRGGVTHIQTDRWTDDNTELHTFKRTHGQTLWSYTHSNGLTDRQTNTALYDIQGDNFKMGRTETYILKGV